MAAIRRPSGRGPRPSLFILILLACIGLSFVLRPSAAHGEEYVTAQGYVHAFSNNVTVISSVFALNKSLSLDTSVYAKYTVDLVRPGLFEVEGDDDDGGGAVSGASSAAGGASDTRHELTAGVTHNVMDLATVELYYDYSREKDFTSSTPTVTLKKELFGKNTTLTFGYSRMMDDISGAFMDTEQSRTTNNYYFGLTQVVSPVTIVQAGYSLIKSEGFQSEGVRLVPVDGVAASTCTAESATCMDEVFPDTRTRKAYILGVNHYLAAGDGGQRGSSVKLTFRYYTDDWDIDSYTAEAEYYRYLTDKDLLRINYRFYTQGSAYFFKDSYLSSDTLKSTSPQHRDFSTHLGGARLTHALGDGPVLGPVALGSVEGKYELYAESTGVTAHILMASVRFLF